MNILKRWLSSRDRKQPATGIVLHASGGERAAGAIAWLTQINLSYHFIIDKDGTVTKLVPLSRVAKHAGVSTGWAGKNCNDYTIGICFANKNDGKDEYTHEQIASCVQLCVDIKRADRNIRHLTTHYWISPGRKTDPKGLNVEAIARDCGLNIWKPK